VKSPTPRRGDGRACIFARF